MNCYSLLQQNCYIFMVFIVFPLIAREDVTLEIDLSTLENHRKSIECLKSFLAQSLNLFQIHSLCVVSTMVDVVDLLKYNEVVRHRYFKALVKLPWKELVRNREASFHSIRSIFVHVLSATDYWLDFLQKENLHSKKDYDRYTNLEQVEGLHGTRRRPNPRIPQNINR